VQCAGLVVAVTDGQTQLVSRPCVALQTACEGQPAVVGQAGKLDAVAMACRVTVCKQLITAVKCRRLARRNRLAG
jgi:hypothetical protein